MSSTPIARFRNCRTRVRRRPGRRRRALHCARAKAEGRRNDEDDQTKDRPVAERQRGRQQCAASSAVTPRKMLSAMCGHLMVALDTEPPAAAGRQPQPLWPRLVRCSQVAARPPPPPGRQVSPPARRACRPSPARERGRFGSADTPKRRAGFPHHRTRTGGCGSARHPPPETKNPVRSQGFPPSALRRDCRTRARLVQRYVYLGSSAGRLGARC